MWLILSITAAVVVLMLISAASKQAGFQKLQALCAIGSSDEFFRGYWRHLHLQLTGSELNRQLEDGLVTRFFLRHLEIMNILRTLNIDNLEILKPVLTKQEEDLENEIAQHIGGKFAAAWQSTGKSTLEKLVESYYKKMSLEF